MKHKISVITVVYNGGNTLEDTIQSILALDHPDVEIIIIDGGSKDNTVDIIKKYADKLSYWCSEKDKGIYDAMNKGWQHAGAGHYILYLGSGDKVLKLPNLERYSGSEIIYGSVYLENGRLYRSVTDYRLKLGSTLHHQALLINKSVHPAPPFSLEYRIYADFDFNQRLKKQKLTFVYDENFLSEALPGGASSKFDYKESLRIVRKNYGWGWCMMAAVYYVLLHIKWNWIVKKQR